MKKFLIFLPIVLLISIIIMMSIDTIFIMDNNVYNYIVIHTPILTNILKAITCCGDYLFIIIISIFLFLFYKEKNHVFKLYGLTIFTSLLNNFLKLIVARPRPNMIHLVEENTYSFPSGHAMISMVFYGYIIYMISLSSMSKKKKILSIFLLSCLILTIGYSRIYLNVHYLSDVLAGYCISIIILYVFIKRSIKKSKNAF